jgi:hypothetical protein
LAGIAVTAHAQAAKAIVVSFDILVLSQVGRALIAVARSPFSRDNVVNRNA